MNKYTLSNGLKIEKAQIDRNIRKAKEQKLAQHFEEYNTFVCTKCFRNDCVPIDCSHIESTDSCQKNGHTEKAWDLDNLQIIGRRCHQKHDKLNLKFTSNE